MSKVIEQINDVLTQHFSNTENAPLIAVKKLMPSFIKAGIFTKDVKNGLPIRQVLKDLDREDRLDEIPFLHYVRKGKDVFWYFKREGHVPAELEVDRIPSKEKTKRAISKMENSDKQYVLDLCDRTTRETGLKNHTFDWLVGDMHRNGRTRSKLPCDSYYSKFKLVVDYIERPLIERVSEEEIASDQEDNRSERDKKRALYVERKRERLPSKGYTYFTLPHDLFDADENGRIIRDRDKDVKRVASVLGDFLKGKI